jgi:Domain of unknown function (DUF5060)
MNLFRESFALRRRRAMTAIFFAGAVSLCLLPAAAQTTNYIVDQFDSNTAALYINQDWGTAVPVITWDDTQNAITTIVSNNPGSGSAKWEVPWTTKGDQIEVARAFNVGAVLNLNSFSTISFDIMFATNSATDGSGSYGGLEIDAVPQAAGWPSTALAIYTSSVANGNGWIHVSLPVNAVGDADLDAVTGIGFKIQQSSTGANLNGTTIFWIDNIIFSGFTAPTVTGPPQIIQLNPAQCWQRLEFQITNVPPASNPFDPDIIKLDSTFTMPSGKTMVMPAFWYQGYQRTLSGGTEYDTADAPPQWRLRFTPPEAGAYSLSLAIQTNGVSYATLVTNFSVASKTRPSRFGYVGIAAGNRYFQTGDGQALPLNGEDVAWWDMGTYDYDSWFASMQSAGENFARVWMSPWCFGIEDSPGTLNNYALQPAWQLDYVLQLAEQKGIYLQLTLDDYREYSSISGADYWPSNPYDVTNGGPCVVPNSFVTNSAAMTIYQKRLRYLVGRYGYSQNLLAWEFFNEIDHDYASVSGLPEAVSLNPASVDAWHEAMGNWMHTNDPYNHLLTTSVTYVYQRGDLWILPQISYTSEHSYNESNPSATLAADAQSLIETYGKPLMVGEFGTSWQSWEYLDNDPYYRGFREGVWGGALGGSAGTAMSWWWQNLDSAGLYTVYSSLGSILNGTGWGTGLWTNITFYGQSPNAIGLSGPQQSLIYLVATNAIWPAGATNASLPLQLGQTVTLTHWPAGEFYARWYDPATASFIGYSEAMATNGSLTLSLPGYSEDLAGIIYPPPSFAAPELNQNGTIQLSLTGEVGGIYNIQKSSDLVNWTTFLTVTNTQGSLVIEDAELITNSAMFYRAQQN